MTSIEYVVRDATGSVLQGTFPQGSPSTIHVNFSRDISLHLGAADVAGYERIGNDLIVTTTDGQQLVLSGYYDASAVAEKNLYLSEYGEIIAVDLADAAQGAVPVDYVAVEAGGKYSVYDDLLFLDLDRVEPVVAPLAGPLISPLVGLLGAGAAAGAALLGGGNDGGGAPGIATPTVDDAGETYLVGGTEDDSATISGTGEPESDVVVTIGDATETTTIGDDGTWETVFDDEELPDDGVYPTEVTVTDPEDTEWPLDGPTVDIDTTPPDLALVSGVESTGDLVNAEEHEDGAVIAGTGEPGAAVVVEVNDFTYETTIAEDGTWSVVLPADQLPEGEYTMPVTATATDARGNATVITDAVVVDTIPPESFVDTVETDDVINAVEAEDGVIVTGTGEPGSTLVIETAGASKAATVGEDGTWSVSYGSDEIGGGVYDVTLTVTSTDAAGNSSVTTHDVHVDTETALTVDPVAGDNIVTGAEAAAGVAITGTGEPGATITVDSGGVSRSTAVADDGTWSISYGPGEIAGGTYDSELTVTAIDIHGNVTTKTGWVTVDTETTLTVDPVAGDNVINGAEAAAGVAITGTGEPGATITVDSGGGTRTTTVGADSTWSVSYGPGEIAGGTYDAALTVTATDGYGNTASQSGHVHVDTETSVTLDPVADADGVLNAAEMAGGVVLTGTAEPGASVDVTVEGTTRTATAAADGTWSAAFEAGSLPDGEYTTAVSVTSTDAHGNTASTSGEIVVDSVTAVSIDPAQAGGDDVVNAAENEAGIVLTGHAEAGSTVNVTVAGVTRAATVDADGGWTAAFGAGSLPEGEYDTSVEVASTDAAGNTASASQPIRVDTVAGEVTLSDQPIEIDDIINDVERSDGVVITGTATPGLTVTVTLGDAETQTVADGAGNWSVNVPAASIPEGNATLPITASITDAAGNHASVSDSVALDTVLDVTLDKPIEGDNVVNAAERSDGVTLSGTVEQGSSVVVDMAGVTRAAMVDSAGNWTVDFAASDIPEGTQTAGVTVTATDAAGNVSVLNDSVGIDTELALTSAPDQTADDILNAVERAEGVTLSGTVEAGASVTVEMMGISRAATVDAAGNWTVAYAASELPEGTYEATATVTATDAAGNTTSLSESFAVDTEIDSPDVDSVTFTNQDVWRIATHDAIDSYAVYTLETDGTVGEPDATVEQDPLFGTEFTFQEPVSDGTNLVVARVDDAGNTSATLVVLEDNAGNGTTLGHAGLADFDLQAINLEYGEGTHLTLTETDVQSLSASSKLLTIHGNSDDTVTASGATATGETKVIDGDSYSVYTLGDDGTTLVIEDEITVII